MALRRFRKSGEASVLLDPEATPARDETQEPRCRLPLAGIGARLRLFPVRVAVLAVGWAVFLGTLGWVLTFPISL